MNLKTPAARRQGYTLTEVILAMSVVAVALPLILGLVVAGGESSRKAERETRAVLTAQTVFEEIRRAQAGNSDIIGAVDLPWAEDAAETLTEGVGGGSIASEEETEWLIFELDGNGEILGRAENMTYDGPWEGEGVEVVAVAAVRGYFEELEDVTLADGEPLRVFLIEVRVESPARAEARNRSRFSFTKSDSLR